ncbi:MAG: TdeIII family type II restriction endonuclease, partial [Chloroflexota bacterium]
MDRPQQLKSAIQSVIAKLMDGVLENVLKRNPFDELRHRSERPLYAALVPDEIFKGSHFERRFVTPFGGVWEQLAAIAAQTGLGYATTKHRITGMVKAERLQRIQQVLDRLEHPSPGGRRIKPDWDAELAYILEGGGEDVQTTVVCDVYAEDTRTELRQKYAFEVKAPLPDSDQTKVSKEKLLKLQSMNPLAVDGVYFALPYNPYGVR